MTLSRALKALPDRKAPRTLLARILAEAAARESLPWWRRPFWAWPAPARAGLALALACGAALLVESAAGLVAVPEGARAAAAVARALAQAGWALRLPLLAAGLVMGSACVGLGAALSRLTFRPLRASI